MTEQANHGTRPAADMEGDAEQPKLKRKEYEKELRKLQTELCSLQDWVKQTGERIIVVFEGRDAAGKGGTIRALTERVSPRTFRLVALPAPSDREKTQMYIQRYLAHFPAAGEIVIFDRSWYNRAGVEYVMGFCTKEQHKRFLEICPAFEKTDRRQRHTTDQVLARSQQQRAEAEIRSAHRRSPAPMEAERDGPSLTRAVVRLLARARQMLDATDTDFAPWHIVRSDDKKRARLNILSHFLSLIPYEAPPAKKIKLPNRDKKHAYDDEATTKGRRWIKEKF